MSSFTNVTLVFDDNYVYLGSTAESTYSVKGNTVHFSPPLTIVYLFGSYTNHYGRSAEFTSATLTDNATKMVFDPIPGYFCWSGDDFPTLHRVLPDTK